MPSHWLAVRGLFAGVVRKKLGLNLTSEKSESGLVYRIDGAAGQNHAAGESG